MVEKQEEPHVVKKEMIFISEEKKMGEDNLMMSYNDDDCNICGEILSSSFKNAQIIISEEFISNEKGGEGKGEQRRVGGGDSFLQHIKSLVAILLEEAWARLVDLSFQEKEEERSSIVSAKNKPQKCSHGRSSQKKIVRRMKHHHSSDNTGGNNAYSTKKKESSCGHQHHYSRANSSSIVFNNNNTTRRKHDGSAVVHKSADPSKHDQTSKTSKKKVCPLRVFCPYCHVLEDGFKKSSRCFFHPINRDILFFGGGTTFEVFSSSFEDDDEEDPSSLLSLSASTASTSSGDESEGFSSSSSSCNHHHHRHHHHLRGRRVVNPLEW